MSFASGMMALVLALTGTADPSRESAPVRRPIQLVASTLRAQWVGQDGQDYIGGPTGETPSGVQDIHIVLSGLPPRREIQLLQINGFGGDEWRNDGKYSGPYKVVIRRAPGSRTADLYLEPTRVENGRHYDIHVQLDDGSKADVTVRTRKADPAVRMPNAALVVKWVGQDKHDWAGPTPGVGPDGLQDVRLALSRLSPDVKVVAAELEGPGKARWDFGVNPQGHPNAELVKHEKDNTQADFYFQPDRELSGQTLKLVVTYENGKTDSAAVTAGRAETALKMAKVTLPTLIPHATKAAWVGQDGGRMNGPGEVHLVVTNLPAGRSPVAAVLSDSVQGVWWFQQDDRVKLHVEPDALPLGVRRGDRGQVDLFFAPNRDETGATMTLRLDFADGASAVVPFPGGSCDPALRASALASGTVAAKPGDDLQGLVDKGGTVRLARGVYPLARTLVLNQPAALLGEPGAVLQFTQRPDDKPWTAAIKIHRGPATLHGFAVRFTGPVRWNKEVSWGPALIALTDNLDPPVDDTRVNLTFTNLDIEAPPSANPKGWEDAPHLMRLLGARGGKIAGNVLRGGAITLFQGPWRIEDNDYRGTSPGTVSSNLIAIHMPHDVVIRNNRLRSVAPSGKTWRFLVLVGSGFNDRVENNRVEGVGPRDDDTIPDANAPETMLTESYRLKFEGKPAAVSADGRLLRVPRTHGDPRCGDVVAVLAGPNAGQWRRIAQAIDPTTCLLETPLPAGADIISIESAFVNETFQANTVDARGSHTAGALVLAGNHFGAVVRNNRFAGGGAGILMSAFPTESPSIFGWSHVPSFGGTVEGNVLEDIDRAAIVAVDHNKGIKSNAGRVYMTMTMRNNTVRWTEDFLTERRRKGRNDPPSGLVIGCPGGLDPGELIIDARDNHFQAPASTPAAVTLRVHGAVYNGKKVVDQGFSLPPGDPAAQVGRRN